MIDTFKESILSIDDAAKHVGKISGKKRNRAVILRWINRGISGVKLDAIRVGSEIFTSCEAVNIFLHRCREAKTREHGSSTSRGMQRATHSELESEAEQLGI